MLTFSRMVRTNSKLFFTSVRINNYSSATTTALKTDSSNQTETDPIPKPVSISKSVIIPKSSMVAAAFASLKSETTEKIKTPFTDEKITKAANIDELLSISEGNGVSRRHALKVVSVLADWSTTGKVNLSDFETDPRFIRLCRILTKSQLPNVKTIKNSANSRNDDLATILSITADDEAAKLVSTITLSQMVKVMTTLSQKKRRSTFLLRALAFNISGSPDRLDLKQCGDLMYSMTILNFPDENLLSRITTDICLELEKNVKKSAVVGSILTSLGLLKYRNPVLLDALSEWVLNNQAVCRPQDIFSLFMTLAVVDYIPTNSEKLFEVLIPQLTYSEAGKPLEWLGIVWSLVLLNKASCEHVSSILNESFLKTLGDSGSMSTNLRLLNIDAAAQYLLNNYTGPRIPSISSIKTIDIVQSKDKSIMIDAVIDSLKNLIHSELHLKTRINTGLGFYIDAECLLDKSCNPLALNEAQVHRDATRIAILTCDYHDMCKGRVKPSGTSALAIRLLEAQGYKVLIIPYTDFRARDKLIHRVKYLETKLKELVTK